MPKIYFFIPDPQKETNYRVATDVNVELSRVPNVGEYVSLGEDMAGVAADYVVVLVHHAAGRPNDTDAEVYLHRVDMLAVKKALFDQAKGPFDVESRHWPAGFQRESLINDSEAMRKGAEMLKSLK